MDTDVLIVGAGPTGLALALWLVRSGVKLRIVDQDADAAPYSRALGVQARTLEYYRQLGIDQRAVAAGVEAKAVNLCVGAQRRAHIPVGVVGAGITPYPYILAYAQNEHERMLIDELAKAGIHVERSTRVTDVEQNAAGVRARVESPNGAGEITALYLAGCDGAHSVVRERLGITLAGGTYSQLFYVADVDAAGDAVNGEVQVDLEETDLLAIFPMKGDGHIRLVGTIDQPRKTDEAYTFDDVSHEVIRRMGITIASVNWFSTYRVHHRVSESFSDRRMFLLGDAAHIHSPVGAQGMNTGIGDAVNLAWKLADVVRWSANPLRLETYGVERMAFARRLVRSTDAVFTFATNRAPFADFARTRLFPIAANITRLEAARNVLFRIVSQLAVHYRMSDLSRGGAGSIRGGDRLPWVERASPGADNFAPLTSLRWQVHVYGTPSQELESACRDYELPLHAFTRSDGAERAGLARDGVYLIRPDGYVALAAERDEAAASLRSYAADFLASYPSRR